MGAAYSARVTLPYRINRLRRWLIAAGKRGVSLGELSKECGLSIPTLSRLKHGRRAPTVAQLNPLMALTGLDAYELLRIERPEAYRKPAPGAQSARAPEPAPREPAAALLGLRPSPAHVQVALRYRVELGPAWAAFLRAPGTRLDAIGEQWRAWCKACGAESAPAEPEAPALGQPGELYAHLKPVDRGPDMRPARAPGTGVGFVRKE